MKKHLFLLCLLALGACSSVEEMEMQNVEKNVTSTPVYVTVPDTCQDVTTQTVENIANMFFTDRTISRNDSRSIKEIHTVSAESGTPLLYIVNYEDEQGFIIISAAKDYTPILAFSETGYFDVVNANKTGVSIWLEEQKAVISSVEQLPDSIKMRYRAMWTAYNGKQEELTMKAQSRSTEDVYRLIGNSVNQWISEGYTVYRLSEYKNTSEYYNLPQEVKTQLDIASLGYANPNYGGREEVSFVLKNKNDEIRTHGPLLQTTWGQENGYNQYTPYQYPAGCVAVAMGQIMKYHQSPSSYNWNAMANNVATSTTARLLADIGEAVDMVYKPTESYSSINNAYTAFKNVYGYTHTKKINHDDNAVIQQILKQCPVYMRGEDKEKGGHAWVCDGYQSFTSKANSIKLMTLQDCPIGYEPTMFTNPYNYEGSSYVSTNFHMNWGWYGNYNGYYLGANPTGYNFSSYRMDLIDLYP